MLIMGLILLVVLELTLITLFLGWIVSKRL